MIDPDAFATGMGLLCGNYRVALDEAVAAMYFAELSPLLSTAEFEAAVRTLIRTEPNYWPSVAKIRETALGGSEAASRAFAHVREVFAKAGGPRHLTSEQYHAAFDAPTKTALWAAGGPSAVLDAEHTATAARAFCAAYSAATLAMAAIAPANTLSSDPEPFHLRLARGNA